MSVGERLGIRHVFLEVDLDQHAQAFLYRRKQHESLRIGDCRQPGFDADALREHERDELGRVRFGQD